MDLKDIEVLILKGNYDKAAYQLFELIDLYKSHLDKEDLYNCLNFINLICDKSPKISLDVVRNLSTFINDHDSWIRLVSLEILYQVSIYRPNLLIELLDKIRSRLFDRDPSVRRFAVKIIGNLISSLYIESIELEGILEEFTEKLMDNDWKVKLQVIKTIQNIINQDHTKIKNLEPLLSMVIINLRDEDEDVARASAQLLKILGTFFISKEKIFYILLYLWHNEDYRVRELIVWLFGEIGKESPSEIIPFIPKIIKFLKIEDFKIQLKVIDALNNIALNNFEQVWANIIHTISIISEKPYRNSLGNVIYQLCQEHIELIFPYLIEELENPSENVRNTIMLVFKRLYDEYKIEIENEITRILYKLESKYWRERKKTIQLLKNINMIVGKKKIAVWITIELNKLLQKENDLDVRNEISYALDIIKTQFSDIKEYIEKINDELSSLKKKIKNFQKIPANFREKLNSYIKDFKFNTTEIQLNLLYDDILGKIQDFHKKINRFEFKRLAFNLIEEWEETKIQVIDELSIIKSFIIEICEEKKQEFKLNLEVKINLLLDRIDILKAQFDYIKDKSLDTKILEEIDLKWYIEPNLQDKFNYFSLLRKNLFTLDVEIREMLINHIEFDTIFKDLLSTWVAVKVEIQIYLNNLDRKIKNIKQMIVDDLTLIDTSGGRTGSKNIDGLNEELSFQIVQGHIQSIISFGIEGIKKFNNNFDNLNSKLDLLTKTGRFEESKKLIEMNSSQIKSFINDTEKQIETIIEKKDIFKQNKDGFDLYVRPFIDKWNSSKDLIIQKLNNFVQKGKEHVCLHEIKYYLKIMNPVNFELISIYVGLEIDQIKKLALKFIKEEKLDAKIINNSIYSPRLEMELPSFSEIKLFNNIRTIGNEMEINLRVNNPSHYDFRDLQITLKIPPYLKISKKGSFPNFSHIEKLKANSNFKFKYLLKFDKEIRQNFTEKAQDEINLIIFYKGPYDISKKLSKKINLLLS